MPNVAPKSTAAGVVVVPSVASPAEKASNTADVVAVAGAESVIARVAELIDVIVAPAGMPVPLTPMPTARPRIVVRLATAALPLVVLPVMLFWVVRNVRAPVVPAVAWAESVIWVAESTDRIVVPAGMAVPVPLTSMPAASRLVVVRLVTTALFFFVVPVIAPEENEIATIAVGAVVACESVIWVAESTDEIVVPAGMPGPVASMPAASVLVEMRLVTTALSRVAWPVTAPAEKVSVTPALAAVALADRVIVRKTTFCETIVVPAGMPMPVTRIPTATPVEVVRSVTTALPLVVVPVMAPTENVSGTPEVAVALDGADSVIVPFAGSTDVIVAPSMMPEPLTSMPTLRPLVVVRLVTSISLEVVLPVMLPEEKVSDTPLAASLAACERVIVRCMGSIDRIAAPAGMPAPVTSMPTFKPLVVVRPVTARFPVVVVPVMAPAVNESGAREIVAVALSDSVIWVAESTERIVVPVGIPSPVTRMPAAKVLVEVRLVTTALSLALVPVMAPAENESATLLALAVGFAESVIWVAESTARIVVPADMPAPLTAMPAASVLVEVRLLTTALPLAVVPVIAPEEKVSDTPVIPAAGDAESVIWVASMTDRIVVPAGMPSPTTTMPTFKPLVVVRLVTKGLELLVLPVMAPEEKVSDPLLKPVMAACESVILRSAGSIARIVVPSGMPVPVTRMPAFRPLVAVTTMAAEFPGIAVPVMAPVVNESGAREMVAVALAESVIWVAESTNRILVPAGMPVPLTTMPAAKALVEMRLVTTALPLDIVPVIAPAENESATLLALAVGFAESVIWVASMTDRIVVPAGMPAPLTTMPAARVLVEVRLLTMSLPLFVVPVMAPEENESDTPVIPVSGDAESSIVRFTESTNTIVVPARMPSPATTMPALKPPVVVRSVTTSLPLVVVPVMAPEEKVSDALIKALLAAFESVIRVAELTARIVVPAGMPVPVTSMPTLRPLVVMTSMAARFSAVVVPVMAPEEKASTTPVSVAVALAESVIWVAESTERIVVPGGMPVPVTTMPAAKVLVEVRPVTMALLTAVVPVTAANAKARGTPVAAAVGFAESVIWVAESTERIVVPAGMPAPVTSMPATKPLVDVRLETTGLASVVLPVMAPAEKASTTPVPVALAACDSVI